jgi:hypothetical protein
MSNSIFNPFMTTEKRPNLAENLTTVTSNFFKNLFLSRTVESYCTENELRTLQCSVKNIFEIILLFSPTS